MEVRKQNISHTRKHVCNDLRHEPGVDVLVVASLDSKVEHSLPSLAACTVVAKVICAAGETLLNRQLRIQDVSSVRARMNA